MTPHQYILRARLRQAAVRLKTSSDKVLEIALDTGFGDLSNFNHAFRAEFGVSPTRIQKVSIVCLPLTLGEGREQCLVQL